MRQALAARISDMAADVALTAATVLRTSLDEHVAQVQAADGALQDPGIEWDSHPMYVGFRRLSTTLSVCQPLLDEAVVALNDEVRWFLGELRPLRQGDLVRQGGAAARFSRRPPRPPP